MRVDRGEKREKGKSEMGKEKRREEREGREGGGGVCWRIFGLCFGERKRVEVIEKTTPRFIVVRPIMPTSTT